MTPDGQLFTDDGLLGGACGACGRRHFPRADWCPWCGAEGTERVLLSTEGTLWSWTAVLAPPPGALGDVPFGFGVVELPDDGLRVITRLIETDPDTLREGQPMRYRTIPLDGDQRTWAFEVAP